MSIKIRKVLYVLLSALMALALGLSLLRLLPGRAEDTLAVAGKYVEPWNNTSGTPGTYGSAKLSDGNYNIVVHNTNNFQGQIYNTVDKVNIEDFSIRLDLSRSSFAEEFHYNIGLGLSSAKNAAYWTNGMYLVFTKTGETTYNAHLLKTIPWSEFVTFSDGTAGANLLGLTCETGIFDISTSVKGEKLVLSINGTNKELPLADFVGASKLFWQADTDTSSLYLSVTGSNQNATEDYYVTVSALSEHQEGGEETDDSLAQYGTLDATTPWQGSAGDAYGSRRLDDGNYSLVLGGNSSATWMNEVLNNKDRVDIRDFEITVDLSEVNFESLSANHYHPALTFRAYGTTATIWGNSFFVVFNRQTDGNYVVRLDKTSNFTGSYAASDGTQVNPFISGIAAPDGKLNIKIQASGDRLNFDINGLTSSLPLADFTSGMFGEGADLSQLAIGFAGNAENVSRGTYITVSPVNDANMRAYLAESGKIISSIETYCANASAVDSKTDYRAETQLRASWSTADIDALREYHRVYYSGMIAEADAVMAEKEALYGGQSDAEKQVYAFADSVEAVVTAADIEAAYTAYDSIDKEAVAADEFAAQLQAALETAKGVLDALQIAFERTEASVKAYEAGGYATVEEVKATRALLDGVTYEGLNAQQRKAFEERVSVQTEKVEESASALALGLVEAYEREAEQAVTKEELTAVIAGYQELDLVFIASVKNGTALSDRAEDAQKNAQRKLEAFDLNELELAIKEYADAIADIVLREDFGAVEEKYQLLSENADIAGNEELSGQLASAKKAFDDLKSAFDEAEARVSEYETMPSDSYAELKNKIDAGKIFTYSGLNERQSRAFAERVEIALNSAQKNLEDMFSADMQAIEDKLDALVDYGGIEEIEEMIEALPKELISYLANADEVTEKIAEYKATIEEKKTELAPPERLETGTSDYRVPFNQNASSADRTGQFYNDETEMYELYVSNEFGGRQSCRIPLDFTALDLTLDISGIPYSANSTMSTFIIFDVIPDAYAVENPKDDIPLMISIVKYPTGRVSLVFYRNWFDSAGNFDFHFYGGTMSQISLPLEKCSVLHISSCMPDENTVRFIVNEGSVDIPVSSLKGTTREVFTENADLTKVYFGLGSNAPEYEYVKVCVGKFYTEEEKEYNERIRPNKEAYQKAVELVEKGLDSNVLISLAKSYVEAIDFTLFNSEDQAKYEERVAILNRAIEEAIADLGDEYIEGYDIVEAFKESALAANNFEEVIEAKTLYGYLTEAQKELPGVLEAYQALLAKQEIDGWTSLGEITVLKGQTDISIMGSAYTDVLVSDQKFTADNFEASIKVDVFGSNWFGFGLMANPKGFNSGVTIDTAKEDMGIFLMFSKADETHLTVQVYVIKSSSVDMWTARRGDFTCEIGDNGIIKIRFYPDQDNRYLQIEVNGEILSSNRVRMTELNSLFGTEHKGYIAIQTCAGTEDPTYFNLVLRTINNKSVFDTGVTVPDPGNLPDYETDSSSTGGSDSTQPAGGGKTAVIVAVVLVVILAAGSVVLVIMIKRRKHE